MKKQKKNIRQQKGKGLVGDLYRWGAKVLTGEKPPQYNTFAQPTLNPSFGLKNPSLITFNATSGPGTNIYKQAPKTTNKSSDLTKISTMHDINYQLTGNINQPQLKKQAIKQADKTMINQLSQSMAKEATLSNFIHHPWKTTANLVNEGVAYAGIEIKRGAEAIGLPTYGMVDKRVSAAHTKMLEKKKAELM